MFRIVLTLCIIILVGCDGRCIEPGKGVSSSSIEVRVPVKPKGADRNKPVTYWVNSGYTVEKNKELKITVERVVNFCPKDTNSPPVPVRMFSETFKTEECGSDDGQFYDTHINVVDGDRLIFTPMLYDLEFPSCEKIVREGGRVVYYGDDDVFSDEKCEKALEAKKLCSGGAAGSHTAVPVEKKPLKLDVEEKFYMKNDKGECKQIPTGLSFPKVGGSSVKTSRLEYPIGYIGPFDNTGSSLSTGSSKAILNGILHDARTIRLTAPPPLDQKNCELLKKYKVSASYSNLESTKQLTTSNNKGKFEAKYQIVPPSDNNKARKQNEKEEESEDGKTVRRILKEYSEYTINCGCGLICDPSKKESEQQNCLKTIVLVDKNGNLQCPYKAPEEASVKNDITPLSVSPGDTNDAILDKAIAFAKQLPKNSISDDYDVKTGKGQALQGGYEIAEGIGAAIQVHGNDTPVEWIPELGDASVAVHEIKFFDKSLRMQQEYSVGKKGKLYLGYRPFEGIDRSKCTGGQQGDSVNTKSGSDSKVRARGYYTINVHRTCYAGDGKRLYMHIGGDTAPTHLPGAKGKGDISLDVYDDNNANKDNIHNRVYIINKGDKGGKQGTLYFGIQLDEAYDDQLKGYGTEENYYGVRLWVTTWTPVFSRFFAYLQGILLHVLYGDEVPILGSDNKAQEISASIRKAMEGSAGGQVQSKKKGAIQQVYNNQVISKPFWDAVRALLTLYIMFTVLGYIIGVVQLTKYDLLVRCMKIVMIFMLISPDSWDFFYRHCFAIFIAGIPDIISAFNGYLGGDSSFAFLDATLGTMLASDFWLRILALMMAGPIGWAVCVCVIWALVIFFVAALRAVIKYLFITLTLAFLVTLAPIFITFLLFQFTKGMFDAWIKMIVNFSLQPIILFAALAFLNQIVLSSLHTVTDFTACETCALGIDIPSDDPATPNKKDICIIPALLPIGFTNELSVDDRIREDVAREDIGFMGLPFGVTVVLILVISCTAMKEFANIADTLAHSISGSVAGITASAMGATQAMLGMVGLDDATQRLISQAKQMTPHGNEKARFESDNSSDADRQRGVDAVETPDGGGDGGLTPAVSGGPRAPASRGDVGESTAGYSALHALAEDRAVTSLVPRDDEDRYQPLPQQQQRLQLESAPEATGPGQDEGTDIVSGSESDSEEHIYESIDHFSGLEEKGGNYSAMQESTGDRVENFDEYKGQEGLSEEEARAKVEGYHEYKGSEEVGSDERGDHKVEEDCGKKPEGICNMGFEGEGSEEHFSKGTKETGGNEIEERVESFNPYKGQEGLSEEEARAKVEGYHEYKGSEEVGSDERGDHKVEEDCGKKPEGICNMGFEGEGSEEHFSEGTKETGSNEIEERVESFYPYQGHGGLSGEKTKAEVEDDGDKEGICNMGFEGEGSEEHFSEGTKETGSNEIEERVESFYPYQGHGGLSGERTKAEVEDDGDKEGISNMGFEGENGDDK